MSRGLQTAPKQQSFYTPRRSKGEYRMSSLLRKKRSTKTNADLSVYKTDEGYRVRLPFDPAKSYLVTIVQGRLQCTCSDFQVKRSDPTYACRHIDAVIEFDNEKTEPSGVEDQYDDSEISNNDFDEEAIEAWHEERALERDESHAASETQPFKPPTNRDRESMIVTPASRMLIKRSLSPDGRIDSVSVELDFPVDTERPDEIRWKAKSALELQTSIIREFLNVEPEQAQPTGQRNNGKGP